MYLAGRQIEMFVGSGDLVHITYFWRLPSTLFCFLSSCFAHFLFVALDTFSRCWLCQCFMVLFLFCCRQLSIKWKVEKSLPPGQRGTEQATKEPRNAMQKSSSVVAICRAFIIYDVRSAGGRIPVVCRRIVPVRREKVWVRRGKGAINLLSSC